MISSTARDLPEHRERVMHACTRSGLLRRTMEHRSALMTLAEWKLTHGNRRIGERQPARL